MFSGEKATVRQITRSIGRSIFELAQQERLRVALRRSPSSEPKILYAGQAGSKDAVITGGRVKLLTLAKRFPESSFNGNIAYLVTSGLPKGAVQWAQQCRRKGIRVVVNQNGVAYPAWSSQAECQRVNERNYRILECADYVFYQSRFCKEAAHHWVGITPEPNEILYNPIDLENFTPAPAPTSSSPRVMRLLLMGSHHHPERVLLAIRATGLMKKQGLKVRLRIAGPLAWKNAENETRAEISSLGLQDDIKFLGPYLNSKAPEIYRSSDVLIHLQDKDASPTVPIEAMACGLQVVAPRSGGLPELIPENGGVLLSVETGWDCFYLPSVESVAHGIEQAFSALATNREKARQWVIDRFSAKSWIEAHERVFQRLLQ